MLMSGPHQGGHWVVLFLCGPPPRMNALEAILRGLGYPEESVTRLLRQDRSTQQTHLQQPIIGGSCFSHPTHLFTVRERPCCPTQRHETQRYRGTEGSTCTDQASIPPTKFFAFLNPC